MSPNNTGIAVSVWFFWFNSENEVGTSWPLSWQAK
jgi:hypothetical protein